MRASNAVTRWKRRHASAVLPFHYGVPELEVGSDSGAILPSSLIDLHCGAGGESTIDGAAAGPGECRTSRNSQHPACPPTRLPYKGQW